jgi:hypothetical protein
MIHGRLFDASKMLEVGRKAKHQGEEFFFDRLKMQSLPDATAKALELKQHMYHCRH